MKLKMMPMTSDPTQTDLKIRKMMGFNFLNENRLSEALEVFGSILRDWPQDAETLVVMGNVYLASGDGFNARQLYQQALELSPGNLSIQRQIELAEAETGVTAGEELPSDPKAVARLLERLTGNRCPVDEDAVLAAAGLLEEILYSPCPGEEVAERLDEIDTLLPALLEINIRQARSDGRRDVEARLRNLQSSILFQIEQNEDNQVEKADQKGETGGGKDAAGLTVVLLVGEVCSTARVLMAKGAMKAHGCRLVETEGPQISLAEKPDIVIGLNPHTNPRLMENLATYAALGAAVVIDLEMDFEQMPVHHPDYNRMGLGIPSRARAYTAALTLADVITVASRVHQESFANAGYPAVWVADGWSSDNDLWSKVRPARTTVNIGWISNPSQLEDLAVIRRAVLRVLREFNQTQLAVIGDIQAYRMFNGIDESRRFYMPLAGPDEYPFLLSQMDILVIPLRTNPFNNSLSDRLAIEASAKGIPWIGSPIPAFKEWAAGGLFADGLDEWHTQLRQLIVDKVTRKSLVLEGRAAAERRTMSQVSVEWMRAFRTAMQNRQECG